MANLIAQASSWADSGSGISPPREWDGEAYELTSPAMLINFTGSNAIGDTIQFTGICPDDNAILTLTVNSVAVIDAQPIGATLTNFSYQLTVADATISIGVEPAEPCAPQGPVTLTPSFTPVPAAGFVFAADDTTNPSSGPGVMTTLMPPPSVGQVLMPASYVRTEQGMAAIFFGYSPIYTLQLPEDVGTAQYKNAAKTQFVWKSKKWVFPALCTMGAAKVVHDCSGGGVRFRLYVDCCCVFETVVRNCEPFRLPDQICGITFEVELIGCSRVTEVVVAPSMRELIGDDPG
jgi:hypothetical protein